MTLDWKIVSSEVAVLQEVLESSIDGFIALDKAQKISLFNRGAEKIFGYRSDEVVGKGIEILLPDNMAEAHRAHIANFSSEANPSRMMGERRVLYGRAKDGRMIPLDIAIQHHQSDRIHYTALCRDISHRIDRERKLSEQKSKFEALFNGSDRLIFLMDSDGVILEINSAAKEFLAAKKTPTIGNRIWDRNFWKQEIDEGVFKAELARLNREGFANLQATVNTPAGGRASLDIRLKKFTIEGSDKELFLMEAMDVTRHIKTNEALSRSERSLARAQKIARLGNWDWDILSNDVRWSDEVFRIFGLLSNDVTVSYPAFLGAVHPEDRLKVERAVANAVEQDKPYNIIHRIITPDGQEKVVHELGEVLRDKTGQVLSMRGTVQDITENWHREKALSEARSKAEAANRAKSQFLATMSHELRTPLNAIIGFSSSMRDGIFGELDKRYQEYVGYIQDSGEHLLSIINDILDLSRIEVGTVEIRSDWVCPSRILDKCLKYISEKAHNKCITMSVHKDEDLPDILLDERHIDQILINLLTNAVKFTDPGGTIELGARRQGDEVELFVRDTGIGMSEDDVKNVFQPFVQADMSYARNHEGVGLGLAIVKQLTELQGGRVGIESAPGEGTRVSVFFKVAEESEDPKKAEALQSVDR